MRGDGWEVVGVETEGRGGAIVEVGVATCLRRFCLCFCRICKEK